MGIYLRKANMDDAQAVLEWRNDPLARAHSFSKKVIDTQTHMTWFNGKLSDVNCLMFVLMDGPERVGQLRIDRVNGIGEISYTIAPDKRGLGYGKKILELAENVSAGGIKVLTGFVGNGNQASKRCFQANHYSEFAAGDVTCYIKIVAQ